ncbi:hypothetical protein JVU11DRAFT_11260 [Chiua virens]|nr:hypothetical protein JVU11DRAFT_11260 [Chiua virens]
MLHKLPAEIALHTISYLPLHSLYSTTLVSRDWNALITTNEPTVYRNAAIVHRFIDEDQLHAGFIPIDWKTYCRRQLGIERGWYGKAPSVIRELSEAGSVVHRIKVDYELGFVIATSQAGGLTVCDVKNNRVLWALPSNHAVRYAHCEYDRGYIVFNRLDNCKEVWRLTIHANGNQQPETSLPDRQMLEVSVQSAEKFRSDETHRGHFKAWALLQMPENARAFRFSYPTLLAAAKNNAYLWDIPRSQMISVIRDIQRPHHGVQLGSINYVEVNDLYVFICGGTGLRIFAREGGALLYQLFPVELSSAAWDVLPHSTGLTSTIVRPQLLLHNHDSSSSLHGGHFMACHVSAAGSDLAVLTSSGRLVMLPDFQRLFAASNPTHHRDLVFTLNFAPFSGDANISYYLAVGGQNGKFALATRKGIYVISPDFHFQRLTAGRPPEPGVSVCRLSKVDDERSLSSMSCLQITHDAIYFTYPPSRANSALIAGHHAHAIEGHDAPGFGIFPFIGDVDDDEDGFVDGWDDSESEEEDLMVEDDDPVHALVNHWLLHATASANTVYSVSF